MKTIETTDTKTVYPYLRWSSAAQTEGDAERRQLQQCETWAALRGMKLSDRTFADRGVSAKAGKNLAEGALGELVKVAKAGDVLLIEDNDRFSRQSPITALASLSAVVNKGVKVVFLRTGVEVTQDNFNDMSVIVPNFFGALLANQENEKKAFRVRESWVKRRELLRSGKVCGQKLPGWLEVVGKPGRNQPREVQRIPEKVAIVVRIFMLAKDGWSSRRIAETLNAEGVPTISGQKSRTSGQPARWNGYSLLACVLRNPQVMGHVTVNGEVVKGAGGKPLVVYPEVISEKLFYSVQSNVDVNKKQTTRAVSQCLTTGLVFCPGCGGNMSHHSNHHSKTGRVYRYLMCAQNKVGQANTADCKSRVRYESFETSLLALLSNSNAVKAAMGQSTGQPSELSALRGKSIAADNKLNELMGLLEMTPSKRLALRVQQLETEAEAIRAELQDQERKQAATVTPAVAYDNFLAELAKNRNEPEYRERIKSALRDVVEKIQMGSDRTSYTVHFRQSSQPMTVWMSSGDFNLADLRTVGDTNVIP